MRIRTTTQGVTASVRQVPTDTTIAVLPLTRDRVGKDPEKVETEAAVIGSLGEAFQTFEPEVRFRHTVDDVEFGADLKFRSLQDFSPEAVRSREPGQRNDVADLHGRIEILQQLRERLAQARVRRAWDDPEQRRQILQAVQLFQLQLQRIAAGEGGAE